MEHWFGRFAQVGEQLAEVSADCSVSFHFAGPAAFDGIIDQVLFTPESST